LSDSTPNIEGVSEDPGTIFEVPEEERLDTDDEDSTHASTGGLDDDGLDDIRANPGEVVPEEDLQ
jgi:hypothetical protein